MTDNTRNTIVDIIWWLVCVVLVAYMFGLAMDGFFDALGMK